MLFYSFDILSQLSQFVGEYLIYLHPGYNIFNTLVFGIILGIVVILIIKLFQFLKKDPKDLLIPIIPFILFGSTVRALVDNGIYPLNYILITPGIYFLTGFITIIALLLSVYIERRTTFDYRYTMFIIGALLCLPNILNIPQLNFIAFFEVLGAWLLASSPFIILRNKWSLIRDKFNLSVLMAQLFDASATFIAVTFYGYTEQHVLPNALNSLIGTALVMYPLKITVILFSLYIIDTYIEDRTIKNMLKLAILILGLAEGLRDVLSLSIGTYM
jgi:uncharacterized membrane protein